MSWIAPTTGAFYGHTGPGYREEFWILDVEPDPPGTVGHGGQHVGYVSLAGCLREDGSVVVVLAGRVVEDIGGMARPPVDTVRSG